MKLEDFASMVILNDLYEYEKQDPFSEDRRSESLMELNF